MRSPGTQRPPRPVPAPGTAAKAAAGTAAAAPSPPSCSAGAAEGRPWALCCAASPASGSAGGPRCPPGRCRPPRAPPAAAVPRTFRSYLPRSHRTYSCVHCRAHLARHEELISKSFQGSHGRAYLFNSVVNVGCGPAEQRLLLTGLHSVADIFCQSCKTTLGWKYEQAFESSQKYKEGKFIIEMSHMVKENGWD
ncbi:LOW QUALITY PROTEIN: protein yippee-like 4 [Ara ararauna]